MILGMSVESVVAYPFSILIVLIWVFSLFILMSLAKGLSILFIFPKSQLFGSLNLCYCFHCLPFISALILMISFLLLILDFVCSFSSCFRCKVRLFIWDFSCFFRSACIAITFPLNTVFAVSDRFGPLCFHFHMSLSILFYFLFVSSVIH